MPSQKEKLVAVIAHRIAEMNGFYRPNTLVRRFHNPGAMQSWGKLPTVDDLAVFPNERKGWEALRRIVDLQVQRRLTFLEFFTGHYPPAKENPQAWAEWAASPFKASAHTIMWSLIDGKPVERIPEGVAAA